MPISLSRIVERRGSVDFTYLGEEVHVEYHSDRITKEFRAETMRLNREVLKSEAKVKRLIETVNLVVAPDGTVEAEDEDEAAAAAIAAIMRTDEQLKHEIDRAISLVVYSWDLMAENGKPVPTVVTVEGKEQPAPELYQVPVVFEGVVLTAILEDATMGEQNGPRSMNNLPLPSKQVARQVTSRRSRTGGFTPRRAKR